MSKKQVSHTSSVTKSCITHNTFLTLGPALGLGLALGLALATTIGLFIATAGSAYGQSMSASGIQNQDLGEEACLSEIQRLEIAVQNLTNLRDQLRDCNENNQVFDGSGCADLASISAEWQPNTDNPDIIEFADGSTFDVIRGRDGEDAGPCPSGTEPR